VAQRRRSGLLTPPTRQWPENSFDAEDFWHPTTPVTSHAPNRPTRLREVRGQTATSRPSRTTSGDSPNYTSEKHPPNITDKSNNVSALLEDTPTSTARKALQDNALRLLMCPMGCRVLHICSQWVCVRNVSEMCRIRWQWWSLTDAYWNPASEASFHASSPLRLLSISTNDSWLVRDWYR
jgi:hypothetical protein